MTCYKVGDWPDPTPARAKWSTACKAHWHVELIAVLVDASTACLQPWTSCEKAPTHAGAGVCINATVPSSTMKSGRHIRILPKEEQSKATCISFSCWPGRPPSAHNLHTRSTCAPARMDHISAHTQRTRRVRVTRAAAGTCNDCTSFIDNIPIIHILGSLYILDFVGTCMTLVAYPRISSNTLY